MPNQARQATPGRCLRVGWIPLARRACAFRSARANTVSAICTLSRFGCLGPREPLRSVLYTVVLLGGSLCGEVTAGSIRVSFLTDHSSMRDTCVLLEGTGCKPEAVRDFARAAKEFYESGPALEITAFPKSEAGFHLFPSTRDFICALPHLMRDSPRSYGINCFDTVILITAERLQIDLHPDAVAGPFFFSKPSTSGVFLSFASTARDMFAQKYLPWYTEETAHLFPAPRSNPRISLTAALFSDHVLPIKTTEEELSGAVLEVLSAWSRLTRLRFPQELEVVLCHEVYFPRRTFSTTHAGLLVQRARGYTYVEKAGGCGPFVRLDVESRTDLLPWLASQYRGLEDEYTHLVATFNDASAQRLEHPK